MRRYCNVFYCDKRREYLCCATCQSRGRCRNRCLNHPDRCLLEDVKRREDGKELTPDAAEEKRVQKRAL